MGTKEKIHAAATELFGIHGLDSVSVRDITSAAGVNLSALTYHYKDKQVLMEAVINDAVEKINLTRQQILKKEVLDANNNPSLNSIIKAFVAPVYLPEIHQTNPRIVTAITARTLIHNDSNNPYNRRIFVETTKIFLDTLSKLFPNCDNAELRRLLRLASGAAISLRAYAYAEDGKANLKVPGKESLDRLNKLAEFITGGFLANNPQNADD